MGNMRDRNSPRGKIFKFKPRAVWNSSTAEQIRLSSKYRSHMVVVLGRVTQKQPEWVEVATVSY